jgi:hypothetical protein
MEALKFQSKNPTYQSQIPKKKDHNLPTTLQYAGRLSDSHLSTKLVKLRASLPSHGLCPASNSFLQRLFASQMVPID